MTDYSKLTMDECKKLKAAIVAKINEIRRAQALPPIPQDINLANLDRELGKLT